MKVLLPILILTLIATVVLVVRTEYAQSPNSDSSFFGNSDSTNGGVQITEEPIVPFTSVADTAGNRIRLSYPTAASINQFNEEILIEYSGINNTLSNEISDGYRIVLIKREGSDPQEYLNQEETVIAAQPVVVNEVNGFTYLTPSELGDGALEHIIFSPRENFLLEVQYVVAGENKASYRELVWGIVQSIAVVE